jgi:hypothetical protein
VRTNSVVCQSTREACCRASSAGLRRVTFVSMNWLSIPVRPHVHALAAAVAALSPQGRLRGMLCNPKQAGDSCTHVGGNYNSRVHRLYDHCWADGGLAPQIGQPMGMGHSSCWPSRPSCALLSRQSAQRLKNPVSRMLSSVIGGGRALGRCERGAPHLDASVSPLARRSSCSRMLVRSIGGQLGLLLLRDVANLGRKLTGEAVNETYHHHRLARRYARCSRKY